MCQTIKDFYTVRPHELEPGDVLVCTVTLHVGPLKNRAGGYRYRVYRCPQNAQTYEGIPQGDRIDNEPAVANALFPVVAYAGMTPE